MKGLLFLLIMEVLEVLGEEVRGEEVLGEEVRWEEGWRNRSTPQHLRLLASTPTSVVLGGREVMYTLALPGLQELREEVSRVREKNNCPLRSNLDYFATK